MKISHEECLRNLNRNHLSFYELDHRICGSSRFSLVKKFQDIEIWERKKSDGSVTFALVFRHGESWLYWVPSHNQVKILGEFLPGYYKDLDDRNRMGRK